MQDVSLTKLLSEHGFKGEDADMALILLQNRGLTRPGKRRISACKITRVSESLSETFIRVCGKDTCIRRSAGDLRQQVLTDARCCDICGGQDNRRAVNEMLHAMRSKGVKKLLVVGGSPNSRKELERLCNTSCELRFITGEENPVNKKVNAQRDWADIVLIWASTQISHKTTSSLHGPKVITVTRRGITALASTVCDSLLAKETGRRPISA